MSALTTPATAAHWRLCAVLLLELIALFYLPRLAVWRGVEREVQQVFIFGCGAAFCLVLLVPVILRGSGIQRLWGILLSGLPLVVLYWVGVETLRLSATQ